MKLLLIQPSHLDASGRKRTYDVALMPSNALATLAALTPQGVDIRVVDDYVEDIDFDQPVDLVGITGMTSQMPRAYQIADEFRKRNRRVVMGGIHASALPQEAGRHADAVVLGEAEGLWATVIADARRGRLQSLPGGLARTATIVHATGSGGTGAGLILGKKLLNSPVRVVGVNVCDDRDHFTRVIGGICEEAVARFGLGIGFSRARDIEIIDGYVGEGYALSRPQELGLIRDVARAEGIFLDPVYTGKAFYGMVEEIRKSPGCLGGRIVFIHTGGLYGLFPKAGEIAPLLGG